jgi:prepilin-type N-terminal cleavage/methylation domain-containing protein
MKARWTRRRRGGFTLVEVMVSLGILALLTGMMFSMVWGVASLGQGMQYTWTRHQQIYRFFELVRRTAETFPAEGMVRGEWEQVEGKQVQALIFRGLPSLFNAEAPLDREWETVLQIRELRGGTKAMYMLQRPVEGTQAEQDYVETEPLMLLNDLVSAKWEYYNGSNAQWLELWTNDARPQLIRLELVLLETEETVESVIWVPPLLVPAATPAASTGNGTGRGRGRGDGEGNPADRGGGGGNPPGPGGGNPPAGGGGAPPPGLPPGTPGT